MKLKRVLFKSWNILSFLPSYLSKHELPICNYVLCIFFSFEFSSSDLTNKPIHICRYIPNTRRSLIFIYLGRYLFDFSFLMFYNNIPSYNVPYFLPICLIFSDYNFRCGILVINFSRLSPTF